MSYFNLYIFITVLGEINYIITIILAELCNVYIFIVSYADVTPLGLGGLGGEVQYLYIYPGCNGRGGRQGLNRCRY